MTTAHKRLADFLKVDSLDRLFTQPLAHPTHLTGFCPCEHSFFKAARFYIRAAIFTLLSHGPSNKLRIWFLKRCGVKIGNNVIISAGTWIDPIFPQLLTIEDNVFIGTGVKIATHEYRMNEFRAGRVIIREGTLVGGFATIGCNVEIGQHATIAAAALIGNDIPPHATAIGNPARILRKQENQS